MAAPADNCVLSSLMSNTTSWSLANDDALLGALQDISENLLSRTAQVLDKMDKLAHKAISVQIKLDNANNNFLGLSNTKFIEARVYDDNDEAIKTEDVPDNKLQHSEEEIIVEAFKQGLEFVNSDFEKVPIENSDSESDTEEEKTFYVLQPINKYHLRPLPAIIGTSEWFDDDKIGLADEVKGGEDEVQSETESEDESEAVVRNKDKSDESDFSSDSDTELQTEEVKHVEQVIPPSSTRVDLSDTVSEFSDDDDDELFKPKPKPTEAIKPTVSENAGTENHDSEDIDSGKEENLPKSGPLNFADELSSKLGLSMAPKLRDSDEKVDDNSNQSQNNDREDEKSKPRQKLMQKSTLFDSSDSDDDLFSGKASLPKKAVKAETPKQDIIKSEPLSTDRGKVIPASDENRATSHPPQPQAIIPPAKRNILVDSTEDESDNEEPDIFADLKVTKPKIDDQDKKQISKGLFSLSDDSDTEDDIFADIGKATRKAKTTEDKPESSDKVSGEFSSTKDLFTDDGSTSRDVKDNESLSASEEMSGHSNERAPKPEDVTNQPKRAPVGGVSMFGKGFNLGSLLKKKVSSDNVEAEDTADGEKVDTATKKGNNEVEQSIAQKSAISDSSVLPINVGDMPSVEAKALDTVTRSRPKMNKGRRPPTRAGRKKVEEISLFTDLTEDKETDAQQTSAEVLSSENVEPRQDVIRAPIGGISLFGGFNPADVFNNKSKEKEEEGILGSINSAPEDFSDSPSMAILKGENKSEEDNSPLFNGPPPMDSKTSKDTVSKGLFGDSDSEDDLFGDLITTTGEKPNVPFSVKNNMFGFDEEDDDDDDIFSDIMKKNN